MKNYSLLSLLMILPIHLVEGMQKNLIDKAIRDEDIKTLEQLITPVNIDSVVDINQGWRPLHLAVYFDRRENDNFLKMTRFLLEQGADPNIPSNNLSVPLCLSHHSEVAQLLLNYGAKHKIQNEFGSTPLHYQICDDITAECYVSVKVLLLAGANPLIKNKWGHSPLSIARDRLKAHDIQPEVVALLEEYAAGFTQSDSVSSASES